MNTMFRTTLQGRPALSRVAALLALALTCFTVAAAGAGPGADADARYQKEKAVCLGDRSHQDRATCLKEADAALAESATRPAPATQADHEQNALVRCKALPDNERAACQRRIAGEGSSSGSVEGGGVLRTIVTPDDTKPDEAREGKARQEEQRQ
jgi:hypothetical protein